MNPGCWVGFGLRIGWDAVETGRILTTSTTLVGGTTIACQPSHPLLPIGTELSFEFGTGMGSNVVSATVAVQAAANSSSITVSPVSGQIGTGARSGVYDDSVLNAAYADIQPLGYKFSVRIMNGKYTPTTLITDGSPIHAVSGGVATVAGFPNGGVYHEPYDAAGVPNALVINAAGQLFRHLFAWADGKNSAHPESVPVIWAGTLPGMNYAELWYGEAGQGGDYLSALHGSSNATNKARMVTANNALQDRIVTVSNGRYPSGFGLSGLGTLWDVIAPGIASHSVSSYGAFNDIFYVNANGWAPGGEWGSTQEATFDANVWSLDVNRGVQDISPTAPRTAADWIAMFGTHALLLPNKNAIWTEVYAYQVRNASGTGTGISGMQANQAAWDEMVNQATLFNAAVSSNAVIGEAAVAGAGAIAATGAYIRIGRAGVVGAGAVSATGKRIVPATAGITGGGIILATASVTSVKTGVADVAGAGAISATGSVISAAGVGGGNVVASKQTSVDATSFTTDSGQWTPVAGRVYIATFSGAHGVTAIPQPTVNGNGITWYFLARAVRSTFYQTAVFIAEGTGGVLGDTTVDFAGDTQLDCAFHIVEFTGARTNNIASAPGPGTPIPQAVQANATSGNGALTLAAPESAGSRPLSAWNRNLPETATPQSGWTKIAEYIHTSTDRAANVQVRLDVFDTAAGSSYATSTGWTGVAIEIASSGVTVVTGVADVAGSGFISGDPIYVGVAAADVAGAGAIAADYANVFVAQADVAGGGEFATTAVLVLLEGAAVEGGGDVSGVGVYVGVAAADIAGAGEYNVREADLLLGAVILGANGMWQASGLVSHTVQPVLGREQTLMGGPIPPTPSSW